MRQAFCKDIVLPDYIVNSEDYNPEKLVTIYHETEVIPELQKYIDETYVSNREAARDMGFSPVWIGKMLNNEKKITEEMARRLEYGRLCQRGYEFIKWK